MHVVWQSTPDVSKKLVHSSYDKSLKRRLRQTFHNLFDRFNHEEISIDRPLWLIAFAYCRRRVPNYLIRATSRAKWVKLMNHIKYFFMIGDRSKHVFVSRIGSLLGLMIGCKVKEVEKIASNTRKCLPSLTNVNGITRIVLEHSNDRWLQFHLNRWRGCKALRSQENLLKYSS